MCGERGRSVLQLGRSKIDLFCGATGTPKNEHKRLRPKKSSSKPPLPRKKRQLATPPPPKPDCTCIICTRAADIGTDSASKSKAPQGVFDVPMPPLPAPVFNMYEFYDVFFKSYVDRTLTKPIVLDGFQQFEEVMDPEMEHIWRPILRKPLMPVVYNQRRFRF